MTAITGTHPYADAWPMLGEDDLAELAADIAENGLRDPIVVYGGLILDGRNRYAACGQAGVDPDTVEFDGDDDAALAFVQSANNARRHQSKGSLAASWALSMLAAGKRSGGRWAYGADRQNSDNLNREMKARLGTIADHARELLTAVRDDEMTLNAAFTKAEAARDEECMKLEREERIKAEEAEARAFIEAEAPDLAAQVGGPFQTYSEARAVWEKRNREEAERLRRERAEKERLERDRRAALIDLYGNRIGTAIRTFSNFGAYDDPSVNLRDYPAQLMQTTEWAKYYHPDHLHNARHFIDALIEWSDQ